jgi:hypothetical protein
MCMRTTFYNLHTTKHGTVWFVVFVMWCWEYYFLSPFCHLPTWLVSNKVLGCRHAWHSTILMVHLRASSLHWIWSPTMVCIPIASRLTISKRILICNCECWFLHCLSSGGIKREVAAAKKKVSSLWSWILNKWVFMQDVADLPSAITPGYWQARSGA